ARVNLDVTNSEGRHFTFSDASRSVTSSAARVVLAMVQYFVNAERAFVTLHNARRDARARGPGLALHGRDGGRRREHELRRGDREHPQGARVAARAQFTTPKTSLLSVPIEPASVAVLPFSVGFVLVTVALPLTKIAPPLPSPGLPAAVAMLNGMPPSPARAALLVNVQLVS